MDHKPEVEEKCMPKCEKFVAAYEACAERIQGDETGEAHCTVSNGVRSPEGGSRANASDESSECVCERKTDWFDFLIQRVV